MPKDPEVSRLTVYQLSCPHRIYWYTDDGNGAQGGHPSLAYRSFSSGAGKKQLASWLKNHVFHTKVGYKKLLEAWHTYKLKGSKGQRWSLPFGICLACWISHAILSWWSCSDYVTYIMYKLYSDISILNTYIYIHMYIHVYIILYLAYRPQTTGVHNQCAFPCVSTLRLEPSIPWLKVSREELSAK